MNDITKCDGVNCPQRDTCYRFLAKPDRFQSYSEFYKIRTDEKCEYYWEDRNGKSGDGFTIKEIV